MDRRGGPGPDVLAPRRGGGPGWPTRILVNCCRDRARAVVMRLPLTYRFPLVLVYMEGLLVREVAAILDVPVGTVLSRLHRGRKLFERQMWEYAEECGLLLGREGR